MIAPLLIEARCFGRRPHPGQATRCGNALVRVSGMGPERAGEAAERLADAGCNALVSFGTAGALVAGLESGDLLLTADVRSQDGSAHRGLSPHRELLEAITDAFGRQTDVRCLTSAALTGNGLLVEDALARHSLAEHSGSAAVDMESLAIAGVALRRSLPFLAVRCIVDTVESSLPQGLDRQVDGFGRPRWTLALWALGRPSRLPALLNLGRRMARARRSLRICAEVITRSATGSP